MQAVRSDLSRTFLLLKSLKNTQSCQAGVCVYAPVCVCARTLVPVCDGGFVCRYVFVQVGQASGHRLSDPTQFRPGENVGFKVVSQGTLRTRHGEHRVKTEGQRSNLLE